MRHIRKVIKASRHGESIDVALLFCLQMHDQEVGFREKFIVGLNDTITSGNSANKGNKASKKNGKNEPEGYIYTGCFKDTREDLVVTSKSKSDNMTTEVMHMQLSFAEKGRLASGVSNSFMLVFDSVPKRGNRQQCLLEPCTKQIELVALKEYNITTELAVSAGIVRCGSSIEETC